MLSVSNLSISLPTRGLIHELSFEVQPGEVLALLGPSGIGKSTLLDWMVGLLAPPLQARGQIRLNDTDITHLSCEQRQLGLMTQAPLLFPHMDVLGNLKFGDRGSDTDYDALLQSAGLAGVLNQDVVTLSGGQVARVSLLRTLLSQPKAILLDEPFARLDSTLRDQIRSFTWQRCAQIPVVLVTHDEADIPSGAKRIQLC